MIEDGGRTGRQADDARLWQLVGRAVDSGHIRPPESWHTPAPSALVAATVRRWEQRISAWLHSKLSTHPFVLRRTKPDGVSYGWMPFTLPLDQRQFLLSYPHLNNLTDSEKPGAEQLSADLTSQGEHSAPQSSACPDHASYGRLVFVRSARSVCRLLVARASSADPRRVSEPYMCIYVYSFLGG